MEAFEKFLKAAEKSGWIIEKGNGEVHLPSQYKNIPEDYRRIIAEYSRISNFEEDCWFILNEDLTQSDPDMFAWDTFQKISLEACEDEEERAEISAWWDGYFPIVMIVSGDYCYYAIELSTGHIVNGWAPEFEEPSFVAENLGEFFEKIVDDEGKVILDEVIF